MPSDAYLYPTLGEWLSGHPAYTGPQTDSHESVDDPYDNISDADYLYWNIANGVWRATTITPHPAASAIASLRVHIRHALLTGCATPVVHKLVSGASEQAVVSDSTITNAFVDKQSSLFTTSPFTGVAWTDDEVTGLQVTSTGLTNAYFRVSSIYIHTIYTPTGTADPAEPAVRELLLLHRPQRVVQVQAKPWVLDCAMGTEVRVENRLGPTPDGNGWGRTLWGARRHLIIGRILALDSRTVTLTLFDLRTHQRTVWDVMVSEDPPASGVAWLTMGPRSFARGTVALVDNAAAYAQDAAQVVQVAAAAPSYGALGQHLEAPGGNLQLQSSFKNGATDVYTGYAQGGTGSNGSGIADETSDVLFDTDLVSRAVRFTAGDPIHTSDLELIGTATEYFTPDSVVTMSVDHKDLDGEALYYCLQRSADSYWYNESTSTWGAAKTWNAMGVATSWVGGRYAATLAVGSAFTALTARVGVPTTGVAGQENLVAHIQIEAGYSAGSRVITETAPAYRAGDDYRIEDFVDTRVWMGRGHAWLRFVPQWSSADLPASGIGSEHVLLHVEYDDDDYDRVSYQKGVGWQFVRSIGGTTTTAVKAGTVTRGSQVEVGVRWVGSDGELDLDNYTQDIVVDGVKGTAAVAGGLPTKQDESYLHVGKGPMLEPDAIGDLAIWVEADEISGLSDGDPIDSWTDLSGNGNHLTASAAQRPLYYSGILNGLPVIRTNGSSQWFDIPNIGSTPAHWFLVFRNVTAPAAYRYILGTTSAASDWSGQLLNYGTQLYVHNGTAGQTSGTLTANTWCVCDLARNGSFGTFGLDGDQEHAGAFSGSSNKVFYLGCRNGSGYFANIECAMLAAFTRCLRKDEADALAYRCAAKYALTVRGSTHQASGCAADGQLSHLKIGGEVLFTEELADMPS